MRAIDKITNVSDVCTPKQFVFQISDLWNEDNITDIPAGFQTNDILSENVNFRSACVKSVCIKDQNDICLRRKHTQMSRFNIILNRVEDVCLPGNNQTLIDEGSDKLFLTFTFDIVLESSG